MAFGTSSPQHWNEIKLHCVEGIKLPCAWSIDNCPLLGPFYVLGAVHTWFHLITPPFYICRNWGSDLNSFVQWSQQARKWWTRTWIQESLTSFSKFHRNTSADWYSNQPWRQFPSPASSCFYLLPCVVARLQDRPQRSHLLLLTPLCHPLHILPGLVCVPRYGRSDGMSHPRLHCEILWFPPWGPSIPLPLSLFLNQLTSSEDTQACSETLTSPNKHQWRVETCQLPCEEPGADPPAPVKLQMT